MAKPKVGIVIRKSLRERILSDQDLEKLKGFAEVSINDEDRDIVDEEAAEFLKGMDGAMTSWNSGDLTPAILEGVPELKIWAYGAGTVKGKICEEAWEKDVVVTSAAPVIADDVAELTMGFITIGLRRVFPFSQAMSGGDKKPSKTEAKSLFRRTVGVISASQVGQRVMRLLRPYEPRILLYDPFITPERARNEFGAELADLETIAREAEVVTLHAPKLDATYHMWHETHFKLMQDDCVFVNTSRGANLDEAALIAELEKGRFFAFLDVTDPEPPVKDSPLRSLPNVVLTPHCAGMQSYRIGARKVEELRRCFEGEEQLFQVTRDMLDRLA
ncbi:MAG: hydroxyacid dehydrogenase [Candidatus Latescibacteria bacterium]|nr:hydroxyacid dehydrogenase [Candidatus Latescibacterota bacterium]